MAKFGSNTTLSRPTFMELSLRVLVPGSSTNMPNNAQKWTQIYIRNTELLLIGENKILHPLARRSQSWVTQLIR